MLIITHFLNLSEVGFAGALTATYSMFELVTDFAISRFVFSAPRSEYRDALSGAQGLAVVRGLVVGGAAVAAGPVLAGLLSVSTHWADFSVLGIAVAIRSFENLAPRVAERDYHYGPQLTVTVVSSILAIAALFAGARWRHDHIAIIMSLFAQMIGLCGHEPPCRRDAIPPEIPHAAIPGRLQLRLPSGHQWDRPGSVKPGRSVARRRDARHVEPWPLLHCGPRDYGVQRNDRSYRHDVQSVSSSQRCTNSENIRRSIAPRGSRIPAHFLSICNHNFDDDEHRCSKSLWTRIRGLQDRPFASWFSGFCTNDTG